MGYVHGYDASVLASHATRTLSSSAAYLEEYLAPGMRVIDIGCGPGTITTDIAAAIRPGRAYGVDISPRVLHAWPDRHDGADAVVASATALPFPDRFVDIVHAHQVLQHVPEPIGIIREAVRVLRPGGIFAARDVVYSALSWWPELPGLELWRDTHMAMARAEGGEPDAGTRLSAWCAEAGLHPRVVSSSTWTYATQSERHEIAGSWIRRTATTHFARKAATVCSRTPKDLERMMTAWQEWAETPDATFIMPHGEIIAFAPAS